MADDLKLRERAQEHLRLALEHLSSGEDVRLRYAALELRMCIEAIVYNLLKLHRSEASLSLMGTWQPDKMLKELAETVRGITGRHDVEITIPEVGSVSFSEYRLDGPWVRRRYQKLGSLLHVPMLRQLENDSDSKPEKIQAQCEEIIQVLSSVLGSEGFDIKLDRLCGWPCGHDGCAYVIERDFDWFDTHRETTCPECGAVHIVEKGSDYIKNKIKTGDWLCTTCGTVNQTAIHKAVPGSIITCRFCEDSFELFNLTKFRAIKSFDN